jgi:hypothetical protein
VWSNWRKKRKVRVDEIRRLVDEYYSGDAVLKADADALRWKLEKEGQ